MKAGLPSRRLNFLGQAAEARTALRKYLDKIAMVAAGILMLVVASRKHEQPISIEGKYASIDDMGVLVFRDDGTFGYCFATNLCLFSEDVLPPNTGRYRVVDNKQVELLGLPAVEPRFTLEIRDGGKALLLTREEQNATLPDRALYRKQ